MKSSIGETPYLGDKKSGWDKRSKSPKGKSPDRTPEMRMRRVERPKSRDPILKRP